MEMMTKLKKPFNQRSASHSSYFSLGLLLWSALHSFQALAVSDKVQAIFDKKNRTVAPPSSDQQASPPSSIAPLDRDFEEPKQSARDGYKKTRNDRHQSGLRDTAFDGERIFGVGFMGAGSYGIFGAEVDLGIEKDWSIGLGIGTGMTYSTWSTYVRRYFKQGKVNTFFQVGYANWFLSKVPSGGDEVLPSFLSKRFFTDDGVNLVRKRAHLLYPGLGVLFQHDSGLAALAMLQYLVSIDGFNGALFGGLGLYYYF